MEGTVPDKNRVQAPKGVISGVREEDIGDCFGREFNWIHKACLRACHRQGLRTRRRGTRDEKGSDKDKEGSWKIERVGNATGGKRIYTAKNEVGSRGRWD